MGSITASQTIREALLDTLNDDLDDFETRIASLETGGISGVGVATTEEAIAGTINDKMVSPLRLAEVLTADVPGFTKAGSAEVITGAWSFEASPTVPAATQSGHPVRFADLIAAGYLTPASHTKALHDALGLDADLLDGQHGSHYLAASGYTAADVLSKLLTVDGSGTGLDADLLDGQHASVFQLASGYTASDVRTKLLTVDGPSSGIDADLLDGQHGSSYLAASSYTASDVLSKLLTVDGSETGLDADLLDGQHATEFDMSLSNQTSVVGDYTLAGMVPDGGYTDIALVSSSYRGPFARFYLPAPGAYRLKGRFSFSGTLYMAVYKNGSLANSTSGDSGVGMTLSVDVSSCSAGDYLDIMLKVSASENVTVYAMTICTGTVGLLRRFSPDVERYSLAMKAY